MLLIYFFYIFENHLHLLITQQLSYILDAKDKSHTNMIQEKTSDS